MMFGQFFVSKYDVEEQMRIEEGQTKAYGEDIRQTELAVIDSAKPTEDQVVVVPQSILEGSLHHKDASFFSRRSPEIQDDGIIRHSSLPFDLQVLKFFANSVVRDAKPDEPNLATAGFGKRLIAVEAKPSAGADTDGTVDFAAAYVRLLEKDGSRELGTYLFSQLTSLQNLTEKVTVGGKSYDVSLRFRRNYKRYEITLKDVRKDDYVGTSTPRNYSSDIHLKDPSRGVDREIHIWMNNPLRYAGETFYQSGYLGPPDADVETTTLSVVTNAGWMIPYVACMIVFVGLVSHFGNTLLRFLHRQVRSEVSTMQVEAPWQAGMPEGKKRREDSDRRKKPAKSPVAVKEPVSSTRWPPIALPTLIVAPFVVMFFGLLFPARSKPGEFDYRAFGRLPVLEGGRVKPFDTLARNTLRVLSNRETFYDSKQVRQPATRWLLDVISQAKSAEDHAVIRIDNLEVLDLLGLKRRKSHLYSVNEILPNAEKFEEQVDQAQEDRKKLGAENLTAYQRKLLELDGRVRSYTRIAATFKPPSLPPLPTQEEFEKNLPAAQEKLTRFRDVFVSFIRSIESVNPPLAIPMKPSKDSVHQKEKNWESYAEAWATALIDAKISGREPPAALKGFNEILASYADGDPTKFNAAVAEYRQLLERERPKELQTANSFSNRLIARSFGNFYGFEEFFNQVSPFFFCWFPYLFAGVLAAASWLSRSQALRRSAYWLILFSFAVHTLALGARIYISGRPPVTNLYSSAIFIGWAVVLFCLVWELIYKDGIATFLASALGFATLLIAHFLAGDGDTFTVLQAVLDTQFWLATHVVTITLGYAATFLAGGIGVIYIIRGLLTKSLDRTASTNLTRMMYGTICFAMIFSFIGTVLGGLWADDSWGRFWGWDPKENGALIIVLWNALVLHAKWDGMIKDRGLAVLAVGGNIVTSWSWFGVNQLQVGLHSYGFTEGVLLALLLFAASQFVIILAGCMPKNLWWSFQVHGNPRAISGREKDEANRMQVAQHA
jgi:ABC-type transport system involved in cytochrome c biogenesis permease subunit